jgi:arabinofuranosyltransferase
VTTFSLFRQRIPISHKFSQMCFLALPGVVIVGSWLVWKLIYYGNILPNTFYVKISSPTSYLYGLYYILMFGLSYWLVPFWLLGLLGMRRLLIFGGLSLRIIVSILIAWCLYVVSVGGDFMEFRFLVPVLPFLMIVIAWLIFDYVEQREVRFALAATMLLASVHHAMSFETTRHIGSIEELSRYMEDPASSWPSVGRALAKLFPNRETTVTLAATPAGAIPYYSSLPTIDMHGLNDKWVARHGKMNVPIPGHQRLATLEYLLSRGTNLVIGQPLLAPRGDHYKSKYELVDLERFAIPVGDISSDMLPTGARVIEIPIDSNHKVDVLYLVQSPVVDAVIKAHSLQTYPVVTGSS